MTLPGLGLYPRRGRWLSCGMGLNLPTILVILGIVALTLLLTGPGLWSEKWGWRWFERRARKEPPPPPPPAAPR